MPRYNYICKDCLAHLDKKLGRQSTDEEQIPLLFETFHPIFPTVKEALAATQCPICDGHNTQITLLETTQTIRCRGGDWGEFRKKNAAALQRDMALHQLQNNDPYAYMRTASDKADLTDKLRDGSKKKTKKQYFLT